MGSISLGEMEEIGALCSKAIETGIGRKCRVKPISCDVGIAYSSICFESKRPRGSCVNATRIDERSLVKDGAVVTLGRSLLR